MEAGRNISKWVQREISGSISALKTPSKQKLFLKKFRTWDLNVWLQKYFLFQNLFSADFLKGILNSHLLGTVKYITQCNVQNDDNIVPLTCHILVCQSVILPQISWRCRQKQGCSCSSASVVTCCDRTGRCKCQTPRNHPDGTRSPPPSSGFLPFRVKWQVVHQHHKASLSWLFI